jgi:retron-type reverse transcriptase
MKIYTDLFNKIVHPISLFKAWEEFKRGKCMKPDVIKFEKNLEQNIFQLCRELKNKTYRHGPYYGFFIYDPKLRHIHKALVRDRILHHALFKVLNPIFEPTFIPTSFSCRIGKGTHKGVEKVAEILREVSKNNTRPCYALKCDVSKFFNSIDHRIMLKILGKRIIDTDTCWLLKEIIESYPKHIRERERERETIFCPIEKGVPIGNLTSQIFANIYMNIFDQFVKHELKVKYYVRYTDDFIIVADNTKYLEELLVKIQGFLEEKLCLKLHPKKVLIRKYNRGIDFLGYVMLPNRIVMRTKTRKRMVYKLKARTKKYRDKIIDEDHFNASLQSYLGVLSHADTYELTQDLKNKVWFWINK